jgi:hypothetical protein
MRLLDSMLRGQPIGFTFPQQKEYKEYKEFFTKKTKNTKKSLFSFIHPPSYRLTLCRKTSPVAELIKCMQARNN